MANLFRHRKKIDSLPSDVIRLSGHTKVMSLPDGERIVTASEDNALRIFSHRSGECMHTLRGHTDPVLDVAMLSEDTMVSVSEDKTARLWHISDATLMHTVKFEQCPLAVASLGAGRFVVGLLSLLSGDLCEMLSHDTAAPTLVKTVTTAQGSHEDIICDISVCGGRFATASWDMTVKVWDSVTLQCLATLAGHLDEVDSIALSDAFVVSGSRDTKICVYDSNTFQLLRKITTHSHYVFSVLLVGAGQKILSSSADETVAIHNASTGDLIWRINIGDFAYSSILLTNGHIASVLGCAYPCTVVVYSPPPHIISQIAPALEPPLPPATPILPPLQLALSTSLSGQSSPVEHCNTLITYKACRVSLGEWCSAHHILILAVRNSDIEQSTEHNGEISWWFEQLYLAIKDITLSSEEDLVVAKRCLREAKSLGLIEGIEGTLGALHVSKAIETEIRAVHRAGILIFQQVLQLEVEVSRFKESVERYQKYQLYSQLIGIALQVIPIVGGAAAGALSAGAQIVEGLSYQDVADYAFGLGSSLAQDEMASIGDRMLRRAAETLGPEHLDKVEGVRREKIEELVESCGLRVDELRESFLQELRHQNPIVCSAIEINIEEIKEDTFVETESSTMPGVCVDGTGSSTGEVEASQMANWMTEPTDDDPPQRWKDSRPSEVKDFGIGADKIRELCRGDLATVWAAFVVRHDDRRYGEFKCLRECFYAILIAHHIFGDIFADKEDGPSADELVQIALDGISEDHRIAASLGIKSMVRRFVSKVRKV